MMGKKHISFNIWEMPLKLRAFMGSDENSSIIQISPSKLAAAHPSAFKMFS